jgi:hypothetical protein
METENASVNGQHSPIYQNKPFHDPLVCGLDLGLCPGCQVDPPPSEASETEGNLASRRWLWLESNYGRLLQSDQPFAFGVPAPLTAEDLLRLAATFIQPETRRLLLTLVHGLLLEILAKDKGRVHDRLLELLADDIGDIALSVAREVASVR